METPPFVAAKYFLRAHRERIDWVVLHTMEIPEVDGNAMRCALAFQREMVKPKSAHYCVDPHQVIQCVRETDVAWHAPMANRYGIGIELAGYSEQSAPEWDDARSRLILMRAAVLSADICHRRDIPVVLLSPADLVAGRRGITDHASVSKAFGRSTHWDPGPNFPWAEYIAAVAAELTKLKEIRS